jgi:glycosyltransferase involved in cell wall biosynthesis
MPADKPKISVIIPIYNVERYLFECLDSIRNQSFSDFEAICVNDGSTDGSRDIIASFLDSDPRFKAVDKPNSGYGASMNRGLNEATGDYIAILESDDFYETQTLERLFQTITSNNAEVVKANYYLYWSDPEARNEVFDLVPKDQCGRIVNPQIEHEIFFKPPSVWAAMYSRDFIEKNEILFLESPGASYQDTSWNFKIWFCAERAVFLDEAFVHYRQDNQNSSVKAADKVYCVVDEYKEMDRYLSTRTEQDWLHALKTKMKYNTYMWNYDRLADEFKLEFIKHMASELSADIVDSRFNWSYFNEWDKKHLESIVQSPETVYAERKIDYSKSKLSRAWQYYRIGGFSLLLKALKRWLVSRFFSN